MKICTKCGVEKEVSEFYKRKDTIKNGYRGECKKCHAIKSLEWSAKNPEKRKQILTKSFKKRYKADPDKLNNRVKDWREKNPDKLKQSKQAWRAINKEKESQDKKQKIKSLDDGYVKLKLSRDGYSKDVIENNPILLEIKKAEILVHRSKKQIKNK